MRRSRPRDGALGRNPEDDEARFARASVLRVMTRYAEAEAEFTRLIDRQPDMVGALSGRSMVRSALGDAPGARADLEALAAAPDPKPAIQHAVALYAAYRYADAAAVIATALERPDLARAERRCSAVSARWWTRRSDAPMRRSPSSTRSWPTTPTISCSTKRGPLR